ncbi:ABC transporter ATP-binding protein [Paenibacillus alkalitolerans]|uniref:ABC transporter ATP-binding protein n=1 Tax=Paenibacillus alkalitolerans TaxID=2799335 RepID=UPI0018F75479|nr:ABC transporter ATP-binding protein [Paenibacillus alkalitolerans]
MTEAVLAIEQLVGGYSRNRPVLRDISLQVQPGELIGLIGLNGAGKSTLMKHIIGLLKPHQGQVSVCGKRLAEEPEQYRTSYVFVPESPLLYDELSVWEHLEFTAMVYGIERAAFEDRAQRLLERFRMAAERNKFARHLSKGMRQKVMIMCAFLVRPPLYLIDEPFLGLDPLAVRALLKQMDEEKRSGAGLIVSSHIISMMETYCDRYVVLHEGNIIAHGTKRDITELAGAPSMEEAFFRLVGGGDA